MTGAIPNAQHYDKCGPMELRMMECMEAYGLHRGLEKCGALYDDFKECFTQQKQRQRFMVSQLVRVAPSRTIPLITSSSRLCEQNDIASGCKENAAVQSIMPQHPVWTATRNFRLIGDS